jgi:putative transposase
LSHSPPVLVDQTSLSDPNRPTGPHSIILAVQLPRIPRSDLPSMKNESLCITRRHLPHWTMEGSTYFVTFHTKRGTLTVEEQKVTLRHIRERDGVCYSLTAAIVMPDHVHLLLKPKSGWSLSRILKGIKGVSARKINLARCKRGRIWQVESYDRIVRGQSELVRILEYMLNNPLKQGLTDDPGKYHGWYCNLENISGSNGD